MLLETVWVDFLMSKTEILIESVSLATFSDSLRHSLVFMSQHAAVAERGSVAGFTLLFLEARIVARDTLLFMQAAVRYQIVNKCG